jgi:hypothetical protein
LSEIASHSKFEKVWQVIYIIRVVVAAFEYLSIDSNLSDDAGALDDMSPSPLHCYGNTDSNRMSSHGTFGQAQATRYYSGNSQP